MNILAKFRIIPITIFIAVLMLSVKVGDLWTRLATLDDPEPQRANLSAILSPSGLPPEQEPDQNTMNIGSAFAAGDESSEKMTDDAMAGQTDTESGNQTGGSTADEKPIDPILFTKSQIELLQDLSRRREEIESRRKELKQLEIVLKATEKRIDGKLADMERVKGEIAALIKQVDAQEEEEILRTVKTYETMKPKDAARIFNEMDLTQLLEIFNRMKEAKAAAIMAKMEPIRAKEVTSRMLSQADLPDIDGNPEATAQN